MLPTGGIEMIFVHYESINVGWYLSIYVLKHFCKCYMKNEAAVKAKCLVLNFHYMKKQCN